MHKRSVGRPRKEKTRQVISVRLDHELINFLDSHETYTRTQIIEISVKKFLKECRDKHTL